MARFAVLVALLGGCAQIFGLDEASPVASVEITRLSVGATLVESPQDLTGLTAEYLVPSDDPVGFTRVPATELRPGLWGAALDEPAPLLFRLPDSTHLRMHALPVLQEKTLHAVMEHPNPEPAPPGATMTVNLTLDELYSGELVQMVTVGAWNFHNLPGIPLMGTTAAVTFDYTAMTSMTGRPHERLTAQDGVVIVRYAPNTFQAVAAFEAPPFEQTGADVIDATLAKFPLEPIEFRVEPMAAVQRYAAIKPALAEPIAPALNWEIRAAPGGKLNNTNGPLMIAAGVALTDTTITAMAGNPFAARGWESVLTFITETSRPYTIPGGVEVALRMGLHERARPAPGVALLLTAGLPTEITLGGVPLTSDGLAIPKPAAAIEVSFVTDVASNTLYQAQLSKISLTGERTLVFDALGTAPRFTLPPELFEAGEHYTLRALAVQGGFPGIADGDLSLRDIPISVGFLDSGVFQVTP